MTFDEYQVDDDVGPTPLRIAKLLIALIPLALLLIVLIVSVVVGLPWLYREWVSRALDGLRF